MDEPEWRRANWDERVPQHLRSTLHYEQTALRAGTARVDPIEAEVLGPIKGIRVLHLQCHFGMDSLTLAQLGAEVVGVDFSAPAIEAARKLAAELGLSAQFVVSDAYEVASVLDAAGTFDRVFVSWGALCWLPDMTAWAKVVAGFLKPGGWLASAEAYPAAYVFDSGDRAAAEMPEWFMPYFQDEPLVEDRREDYADPSAVLRNTRTHEWLHPLGQVVTALLEAGLRIERFSEHDLVPWALFTCLRRGEDGWYGWPDKPWLPLSYSLRAVRPGA